MEVNSSLPSPCQAERRLFTAEQRVWGSANMVCPLHSPCQAVCGSIEFLFHYMFSSARHACTICICVAWCVEGARSGHACAYVSMHVCAVSQAQVRCAQLEGGQAGGHSRLLCRKPHAFFNVKKAPQNIPNLQEQYSMCSVAFGSQSR